MKTHTVFIDSALWMCGSNLVSCSMIYRYLVENGHKITNSVSDADFMIIKSCGVVKDLEKRSLQLYNNYYQLKKKNASIIIFGCLVKMNKELIESLNANPISYDESNKLDDIFYTTKKFKTIKPHCDNKTRNSLIIIKKLLVITETRPFLFSKLFFPFSRRLRKNYQKFFEHIIHRDRIFIEISRGCTGKCSYCSIKKAKGNVKSRMIKHILSDIIALYDPSKQVFLVSDDCGCYGVDIGTNIIELLYRIDKEFPGISINLDNLNPNWLENKPDEFIQLFQDVNISFARIPIQSGSNKIVKKMNRYYDPKKSAEIIDQIKKVSPDSFIYTHFIVGFPGENTLDFLKTLSVAGHFDYPLSFKFSRNEGTASAYLPKQKSQFIISLRRNIFLVYSNFIIFLKLLKFQKKTNK